MSIVHKSLRALPTGADNKNSQADLMPRWKIHTGTVQLFIVGPPAGAWLACSEPRYSGPVGTAQEWELARRAVRYLNRKHLHDTDAGVAEIREALASAKRYLSCQL